MRILYVNHNVAWAGGTFFRAYQAARHLARRGHTVSLLTISPDRRVGFHREERDGVEVVHTPDLLWGIARTGWDPWDTLNRIGYLRGRQWEIIHAWDSRPAVILPALYARRAARQAGGRLVIDWCDWFGRGGTQSERPGRLLNLAVGPVETFFEEAFRTYADGSTVISAALYQRAVALGVGPQTIMRLPQGSDVERVRPLNRAEARERLGWPVGGLILGHLGVLHPKDAELLFAAFRLVRGTLCTARLCLIGRHRCDLGRYGTDATGWWESGAVPDGELPHYLAACDLLLLPLADTLANRARWPSRVNDYLASGGPVVSTAVGHVAGLSEEHGAGQVTKPEPADFAAGVTTLLQDQERREVAGRQARVLAETKLAWSNIAAELEQFYSGLR